MLSISSSSEFLFIPFKQTHTASPPTGINMSRQQKSQPRPCRSREEQVSTSLITLRAVPVSFCTQQSVSKDLTRNRNTWVPGDQGPVLRHRHATECPLTCDGEDINSCEAPWRRRIAVIIQMKDYEKGRAVTPPGGPKEPDARRDVWLLVTVVSRPESAPSAGIASRCVWGLFQPYLQHNTSISLVITQAYELLFIPAAFCKHFPGRSDKRQ